MRTGVGLAFGRDVGVSGDVVNKIGSLQPSGQVCETAILRVGKGYKVASFQFDTDRKVVATLPPLPKRYSCMPCAMKAGYELKDLSVAPDKKMRGDFDAAQLCVIGVCFRIQRVGEQLRHFRTAKLVRRQADAMDDEQVDRRACRPGIVIRRYYPVHPAEPALRIQFQSELSLSVMDRRSMR